MNQTQKERKLPRLFHLSGRMDFAYIMKLHQLATMLHCKGWIVIDATILHQSRGLVIDFWIAMRADAFEI